MYEVLVTGFHTEEQAWEFISWYEGQGEQDSDIWLSQRGFTAYTDMEKYFEQKTDEQGRPILPLKILEVPSTGG